MMSYTATSTGVSTDILLKAPLSGSLVSIDQVPDPVFAQKMVGDVISIDPVSQRLLSPCDGEVIQLPLPPAIRWAAAQRPLAAGYR